VHTQHSEVSSLDILITPFLPICSISEI